MTRMRLLNSFAVILIVMGLAIVLAGAHIRSSNASIQAQPLATAENSTPSATIDPSAISGKPVELRIESIHIRNQIINGVFDANSGQWTLTTDKVQFALMSLQPNDKSGLTFMYGHNRKEVFSRLPKITPGAIATVRTENGHVFAYRYIGSQTVKPQDATVFDYSGPPKLVLQTCSGAFYQNRQLFSFEFVEVRDA